MNGLTGLIILQALVFGGFCSWLAKQKDRDAVGWFFLGLCFSLIALIAIAAVPNSSTASNTVKVELLGDKENREAVFLQRTFFIVFGVIVVILILAFIASQR